MKILLVETNDSTAVLLEESLRTQHDKADAEVIRARTKAEGLRMLETPHDFAQAIVASSLHDPLVAKKYLEMFF